MILKNNDVFNIFRLSCRLVHPKCSSNSLVSVRSIALVQIRAAVC